MGERTRAGTCQSDVTIFLGWKHTLGLAHSCVDDLQDGDGEGGRLSRSRLGLGDGIAALADLHNGTRLDGGRRLVSVCVDTAQEILLQMHGLEGRGDSDLFGGGELHLVVHVAIYAVRHGGLRVRGVRRGGGMCGGE